MDNEEEFISDVFNSFTDKEKEYTYYRVGCIVNHYEPVTELKEYSDIRFTKKKLRVFEFLINKTREQYEENLK